MIIDQTTTPDEVMWSFLMSEYGSASRHWPISIALTSVFRRRTWHHCATVAAAQSPFYFACWLVIASHTHASRVNFSAALRFPGSRVACSALRSSVVIRQSVVFCRYRFSRRPYIVFYYYLDIFDVSNSGALSIFSARSLAVNTQQYSESEQLQVRLTSAVHDDIGNIILRSHNAQISISSWPGNRHKI